MDKSMNTFDHAYTFHKFSDKAESTLHIISKCDLFNTKPSKISY